MTKTTTDPTSESEPRYRWAYPSDWLAHMVDDRAGAGGVVELVQIINSLISRMAEDDIQDLFQGEMDSDGYFQDLNACLDCGSTAGPTIAPGTLDATCAACGADWNEEDHA